MHLQVRLPEFSKLAVRADDTFDSFGGVDYFGS